MKDYPSGQIRNVLLAGHGGTGKTTLAEALLNLSGTTNRIGNVEEGTTVLDFEDEEREKQISISLATAPLVWDDTKINLIDSPGYADFIGEVQAGIAVCDMMCLVVSAVDGVEVQHEIIWRLAGAADLPRMIFVNKVDRDRASVQRTVDQLRDTFGSSVAPIHMPIGEEADFAGLVALLAGKAIMYEGGKPREEPVPDELAAEAQERRRVAMEAIVETDEELMERYFADDEISSKELLATLGKGVAAGETYPVLIGSATEQVGLSRLLDFFVIAGPSPLDRPGMLTQDGEPIADPENGSPVAYVYKTHTDPHVGQISYIKTVRGDIKPDVHLIDSTSGKDERLHQLFTLSGQEHETASHIPYGDLGAVPKLDTAATGDTLSDKNEPVVVATPDLLEPVYSRAIFVEDRSDEDKLANALSRIGTEDPTVRIERNPETHQTLLHAMGETHVSVTLARIKRKFKVDVATTDPKVAYRETARKPSDFEGKHKKQSGGRGQFGVAHVRLEPLGRGDGYDFVDEVVGGAIPKGFIGAVNKGIQERMKRGPLAGYPVVDIRMIVDDGKHHPVDSDENSFKMAGSLALKGALQAADPVLLEPIGHLEVLVPDDLAGDISGDLNSRRGRLEGMESVGAGRQLIKAKVPMAEMTRYAIDLRSLTHGRGTFTIDFDHYEEVPSHLQEKLVAAAEADDS